MIYDFREKRIFFVINYIYIDREILNYVQGNIDRYFPKSNLFQGFFPTKDMQAPLLPPLRSGHIDMKDAECAEKNEKLIFRFLLFELWLIVFTIYW